MTENCGHQRAIQLLRTELKNLRDQVRGLRAAHAKDMASLKAKLEDPRPIGVRPGKARESVIVAFSTGQSLGSKFGGNRIDALEGSFGRLLV